MKTDITKSGETGKELSLCDDLHLVRKKLNFMTVAIHDTWGNKDTIYGSDTVFGARLILEGISEDIKSCIRKIDSQYDES